MMIIILILIKLMRVGGRMKIHFIKSSKRMCPSARDAYDQDRDLFTVAVDHDVKTNVRSGRARPPTRWPAPSTPVNVSSVGLG